MRRPCDIEACLFVTEHVGLELDRVFRVDYFRIRMIEVVKVVHLWLMEFTRRANSSSSNWTSAFLWYTTSVEANVIDIVLFSLLLKLCKTSLCITTLSWGRYRHIT